MKTTSIPSGPLSDPVIMAMAKLVDDGMVETKREPTHSHLDVAFRRAGLSKADPNRVGHGRPLGKAKRVTAVLSWAFEHDVAAGRRLVSVLTSTIQALGRRIRRKRRKTSVVTQVASAARTAAQPCNARGVPTECSVKRGSR